MSPPFDSRPLSQREDELLNSPAFRRLTPLQYRLLWVLKRHAHHQDCAAWPSFDKLCRLCDPQNRSRVTEARGDLQAGGYIRYWRCEAGAWQGGGTERPIEDVLGSAAMQRVSQTKIRIKNIYEWVGVAPAAAPIQGQLEYSSALPEAVVTLNTGQQPRPPVVTLNTAAAAGAVVSVNPKPVFTLTTRTTKELQQQRVVVVVESLRGVPGMAEADVQRCLRDFSVERIAEVIAHSGQARNRAGWILKALDRAFQFGAPPGAAAEQGAAHHRFRELQESRDREVWSRVYGSGSRRADGSHKVAPPGSTADSPGGVG